MFFTFFFNKVNELYSTKKELQEFKSELDNKESHSNKSIWQTLKKSLNTANLAIEWASLLQFLEIYTLHIWFSLVYLAFKATTPLMILSISLHELITPLHNRATPSASDSTQREKAYLLCHQDPFQDSLCLSDIHRHLHTER